MNAAVDPTSVTPSLTRRRRTFFAPLWLLAWLGILVVVAAFVYWNSATTTTIVLIRHAEKQMGAIDDAPLSPQGEQRATRLAQMFGDADSFGRLKQIYVTDTRRTQQTAASLAQRLNLKPVVVDSRASAGEIARRILRENRGGLAIVVGHGNTVPALVGKLSGSDRVPAMGEEEFDTMYVVTVPTIGRASVLRMKY
ncbi:MAG TPA: phosphoglycerate mutase family protein [Steroidobacteraceae bacterium]|jgi:broad specificity phosphatase PhoE|nr:phosphoglycerate mutase family protein [Steroidobacteraceae bacterium]